MNAHERHLFGCFGICFAVTLAAGALAVTLAFTVAPPANNSSPPGALGDAQHGRALLSKYGCVACHDGNVGPPLDRMATRSYIAGRIPNIPSR